MRTLTRTERRYLLDMARGLTAAQSARSHGVTVNTLNTMLKRARAALGAASTTQAVALAFAYGEFTADDVLKGK